MRAIVRHSTALFLSVAVATAANAQTGHAGHSPAAAAAASTREYREADTAMMKAMAVPYTGDADVDFRLHMVPHHEGAIAMARVALRHATDPDTKKLAETIIADQQREIADMRAWLKVRGR